MCREDQQRKVSCSKQQISRATRKSTCGSFCETTLCQRVCTGVFPKDVCLMCACVGQGFCNCSNQTLFDPTCFFIKLVFVSFENDTLLCVPLCCVCVVFNIVPLSLNGQLMILSFLETLEDIVCLHDNLRSPLYIYQSCRMGTNFSLLYPSEQ